MRNLLIALFVFAGFVSEAQYSYFLKIKRQNGFDTLCSKDASPDSLFWKSGNTYTYYAINKVTKYFSQGNIIGLTSALDAKADVSHTHIISNVTGLQAALDAKGTSNFDGAYNSLTGKPTLFDGAYSSLTGKPSTFTPSSHTHTISDISNFGSYVNVSDSASMLSKYLRKTDTIAMLSKYLRSTEAAATYQVIGSYATTSQNALKVNISDTTAALSPYLRSNVAAATYQPLGTYATGTGSASGTNSGDNAVNTTYANDYRAANFVAGTNYLAPNGNGSGLTGLTASQVSLGNVNNTSDANKPVSTLQQAALDLKANLATTPQIVASINATAQAANIATATLYAVSSAGFYRISVYITVTQAATTSSTMPSTTITYTDGNAGTNTHSTTTTATSTGNSVTTTFAQTTYVLYAKASTNIQYATGSYATSGATGMQYALRIRVESL
jgi:hypothetical protein